MLLLLILQEVFSHAAEESTSDRAQEAMTSLFAEEAATKAATNGTKETTIALSHWGGIGIVVWGIGIRGLGRELMVRWQAALRLLALATLTTMTHLLLIGLVLSIGVVASVLLRLAVVARVALWIAGVVVTELVALLAVLESTLLWRAERILSARWAEALILLRVALLRVLLALTVALLGRITLLLAITLLRVLRAVALATVGVVRSRHGG